MERITKKDLKHNNSVKSPNSTVNSSRSSNERKKLYNEGARDDKKVQVDNNKIEVEIYNESKNRPASDSEAEEPTMITHKAVVHKNDDETKMSVMHKAPETGVERKHNNDIKNRIEMSSKTYADIAVANEKITNEVSREKPSSTKKIEQNIKNKQKGVGGIKNQQLEIDEKVYKIYNFAGLDEASKSTCQAGNIFSRAEKQTASTFHKEEAREYSQIKTSNGGKKHQVM
ncbi:hypothetical protein EVAR_102542_1 [Eumeta japonica]|uniref:Uncharacterized protein n=1 Tax=Eumeta variegata TaxID=151549 RepID=A0A4C1S854_EUMVA|nr:hypothetical protein EVAR_102542_1 [Eumeta japonica]